MSYVPKPLFRATIDELYREFQRVALSFRQLDEPRWEILSVPSQTIVLPGTADPGRESATGSLLFDSATTETVYTLISIPRGWETSTAVSPTAHWTKTTSATGDVAWRIRHKVTPLGSTIPSWSTADTVTATLNTDNDTADEHLATEFTDVAVADPDPGTVILFELSRLGADSGDTYGADARLLSFDVLFRHQDKGSRKEWMK